ncbi:MAG: glycerophosphodiester phosphodiesterase [Bacteriovoracaceae bacterium]|mgnify:CR=1 FL=1|jgi:glycerophosphoryl diester phosphodiesterase|nr:glycerophosphodiester phosphodiesterase [Bacteriovoracaceae bacterium]
MKIMGHRGAKNESPENTLKSIQTAIDAGVESVEIDIHLSKDDQIMVIHDNTIDRTTNGSGKILSMTLLELKEFDAGEGEQIPTLKEVIKLVRGKVLLFIEIKADDCEEKVVNILKEEDLSQFIIKSFNHRYLQKVKSLNSNLRTAVLIHALPVDPVQLVRACEGDILSISLGFLDKELVDLCHKDNVEVCAWNCNDIDKLSIISATGVDYLGTDIPSIICAGL